MAEKLKYCGGCGKSIQFNSDCECRKNRRAYKKEDKKDGIGGRKWRELRLKVIKRDGAICLRCLNKFGIINQDSLTVHHIKSRKHYPELMWDIENLITLCMCCNNQLGVSDKLDFDINRIKEENDCYGIY